MAHEFFCRVLGVPVRKVCYFRFGNPAGCVIHDSPTKAVQHVLIGTGPFLFNTCLGALAAVLRLLPSLRGSTAGYVLLWLGVSIAMHSFPSTGDAKSIWRGLWSRGMSIPARLVSIPIVVLIYLGALGSVFWLDLIYGVAVVVYAPHLVMQALRSVLGAF